MNIDLAFSSCPNDTFVFDAMVNGRISTGPYVFNTYMADVEDLNLRAFNGQFAMTKLSFHAMLYLDKYHLLSAGAALGSGCGPLLVSREPGLKVKENTRVAIPGRYTTAAMLLQLWNPSLKNLVIDRFDRIMDGVRHGEYDAGVLIHEGRFVYQDRGLFMVRDLGEWWEKETGLPIPLGCIACRKDLGDRHIMALEEILRESVRYARKNPTASAEFVRSHAQELDECVTRKHINLYVNDYTEDIGDTGRKAFEQIRIMAQRGGLIE